MTRWPGGLDSLEPIVTPPLLTSRPPAAHSPICHFCSGIGRPVGPATSRLTTVQGEKSKTDSCLCPLAAHHTTHRSLTRSSYPSAICLDNLFEIEAQTARRI